LAGLEAQLPEEVRAEAGGGRVLSPAELSLPDKLAFLLEPARYKVAHGGRGGTKSWGFARALIRRAVMQPTRILCTREYQNSIQESVHKLLSDQIKLLGLEDLFKIQQQSITAINGSEFFFTGLKTNPHRVKSMEGVDICWVEEAQKVSEESWQILIPTIRQPGSEIWVSFNPDLATDPTYKRFVLATPPGSQVVEIGWRDNPWLPEELRLEKDYLASVDLEAYEHVWEGKPREHAVAAILRGKCAVSWFAVEPHWDGPYWGADWGFAEDPTTLVKVWVGDNQLFVQAEVYQLGLELDRIPEVFGRVPGAAQALIRGDGSRPDTISYLQRQGLNVVGASKGPGSVEDGIAFLRSFEKIWINPECTHTIEESKLYSYKVDRLTGEVLPVVVDKHNHCIDALRYALEPLSKQSRFLFSGGGRDFS
jgi:phage terminase large subunit